MESGQVSDLPQQLLVKILTLHPATWGYGNICELIKFKQVCKSFNEATQIVLNQKILGVDLRDKTSLPFSVLDFSQLQNLRYLDITYQFQFLHDISIERAKYNSLIIKQFSQLKKVEIFVMNFCDGLNSNDLRFLFESWKFNLREIQAKSCPKAIGDGSCLRPLKNLKKLNLFWNRSVEAENLFNILNTVEQLNLHGCEKVDSTICEHLVNVKKLSIGFTKIDNLGLLKMAENSKKLQQLMLGQRSFNMWQSTIISTQGVRDFEELRPDVTVEFTQA